MDRIINIDRESRKTTGEKFIGISGENLQENIVFKLSEFINGVGRIYLEFPDKTKGSIILDKVEETYQLKVKSALLKQEGFINYCIKITEPENEDGIPIFESKINHFKVLNTIETDEIVPEEYPTWIETFDSKIAEIEEKLGQVDSLDIDVEKEDNVATITIFKKDGTAKIVEIYDDEGGGSGGTSDYRDLDNKPKINNIELNGNKSLSDLGIDQNFVKDDNYVHTDNNYTNTEKEKLAELNNYDDTEIKSELNNKAAKTEIPTKTSDLTNDSNFAKTNENNNFNSAQTVNGTLTVNGDIIQNGETYESHAEKLFTENDIIITRDKALGGLGDGEYTGIEANLYDGEHNGQLVFDNKGEARVGDKEDTQPLLTRDEILNLQNGQLLKWNSETLRAEGTNDYVKPDDLDSYADKPFVNNNFVKNTDLTSKVREVLPLTSNILYPHFNSQTEYYLGIVSQVTIGLPMISEIAQYALIQFTAGENFNITIDSSIVGDTDFVFATGNTYEILLTYNGTQWVMQVLEY